MKGQSLSDTLLLRADSLRTACRFDEALDTLSAALETAEDTLLIAELDALSLKCENGSRLAGAVSEPKVVARQRLSAKDFMLYYPLPDRSWRKTPNVLDSLGAVAPALYAPEDAPGICFAAPDSLGRYDLALTVFADSLWSAPVFLGGEMTSPSNEIYPMLSPDGKTLYFASDGFYGMGGYDLYKSEWDEVSESWGAPENLGFPYSSPYNDFLLADTQDGKYTIFASDRGCPADSVEVYVLEYELNPVRKAVSDPAELARICLLEPSADITSFDNGSTAETEIEKTDEIDRYVTKVREVKSLKGALSAAEASLAADRSLFAEIDDDTRRAELSSRILEKEAALPELQDSLKKATVELQNIEMDFLFKGVVLDPDKLLAKVDREVVGVSSGYTFTKMSFGAPLRLAFGEAVPEEEPEAVEEPEAAPAPAAPAPVSKKKVEEPTAFYNVVITALEEDIPDEVLGIVRAQSDRDMTRTRIEGKMVYTVGPFKDKAEAEELEALVKDSALASAELREIPLD